MARQAQQQRSANHLSQHLYALKNALKAMRSNPWAVAINTAILGISISLSLALHSGIKYFDIPRQHLSTTHVVYLALSSNMPEQVYRDFRDRLSAHKLVTESTLRSAKQTLDETLSSLALKETAGLEALNPFSDTLAVALSLQNVSVDALEELVESWRQEKLVKRVDTYALGAARRHDATDMYSKALTIGGILILFSVALMSANMVRNQLLRQRLEIQITRYCGGDPAFLRRPFLCWGAVQLLLGAITALVIFQFAKAFLSPQLLQAEPMAGQQTSSLFDLGVDIVLLTLIGGALLGMSSAWITSRFHLREDVDK